MSIVYKMLEIPLRSISYLFDSLQTSKKPAIEIFDDPESPPTHLTVEPNDATKMSVYNMRPRKPIVYTA